MRTLLTRPSIARDQAEESMAVTNAFAKLGYESKHQPIEISTVDKVYLRLGYGYNPLGLTNPKLHQLGVRYFQGRFGNITACFSSITECSVDVSDRCFRLIWSLGNIKGCFSNTIGCLCSMLTLKHFKHFPLL